MTIDYAPLIANATPDDVPHLMTSKGNLPEGALRYESSWDFQQAYIMFNEAWYLGDELVKSNAHCYAHNALGSIGSDASI